MPRIDLAEYVLLVCELIPRIDLAEYVQQVGDLISQQSLITNYMHHLIDQSYRPRLLQGRFGLQGVFCAC